MHADAGGEEAECLEGSAGESASEVDRWTSSIAEGALEELFMSYAVLVLLSAGLAREKLREFLVKVDQVLSVFPALELVL